MKPYTLGADPEMFVRRKPSTTKPVGDIVPVCGLVGGTKAKPLAFAGPAAGYKYQEDNVAFEVNIPPTRSTRDFNFSINYVIELSTKLLGTKGLVLDFKRSAHRFPQSDLTSDQALVIGCDPDMRAYGGEKDAPITRPPFDIKDLGAWRFTGGHVHFGWDMDKIDIPQHVMVRLIDAVVYLPIINKDKQKNRRPKYGLAGLYRPKEYGIEYRSMSNFWLQAPELVARRAFNLLSDLYQNADALCDFYMDLPIEDIKVCIDSSGENQADVWSKVTKCANFKKLSICNNHPSYEADMAGGRYRPITVAFAQG